MCWTWVGGSLQCHSGSVVAPCTPSQAPSRDFLGGVNTEDVGSTDCPHGGWEVRVYPSLLLLGLESVLFYLHSAFHLPCSECSLWRTEKPPLRLALQSCGGLRVL
uniref:Uncharacterized protein n=1 Tax=Mus musculus TaxID=10090 RepID=Q3TT26_MOUSE|nr:unnamed protein product [Mus musculus]